MVLPFGIKYFMRDLTSDAVIVREPCPRDMGHIMQMM